MKPGTKTASIDQLPTETNKDRKMKRACSKSILASASRFLASSLAFAAAIAVLALGSRSVQAAQVWNGERVAFTKTDYADPTASENQDRITDNVWITRGDSQGLFNAAVESSYVSSTPSDTEWAFGTTDDLSSLFFRSWYDWVQLRGGPPSTVGMDAVLHLITDDIYIDIKILDWTENGGGGFSYERGSAPTAILNMNGKGTMYVLLNSVFVDPGATATNRLGETVAVTTNGVVDTSVLGLQTITYSITEANSHVITKTRNVRVVDTLPAVWDGPRLSFTKADGADWTKPENQDRLTDNVWLTRANSQGLFNIKTDSGYSSDGPTDTEWAYGSIDNCLDLSYGSWVDMSGNDPPSMVGQPVVLHLISEDIYVALTFTSWSSGEGGGQGGFSYSRAKGWVTVTMNGPMVVQRLLHSTFTDPGATAEDADGNPLTVVTNGVVDVDASGDYTITYSASDLSGHASSAARTVSVLETAPPMYISMMPGYNQQSTYANAALNEPIEVWGRSWGGMGPFNYTLDFGDGDILSGSNIESSEISSYVGAAHIYASSGSKTATLSVTDTATGTNLTRQAVVRVIGTPTHDARINMAIEKGLLYLYKTQKIWDNNRICWLDSSSEYGLGTTGFSLLAFEENGHLPGNDYQEDIYAQTVQKGLNTLVSQAYASSMAGRGELDSNGNGIGINIYDNTYANCLGAAAVVMAFTSTNAAKAALIGEGLGDFAGTNYYDFAVDMIDTLYGSQSSGGGWHYSMNPLSPNTDADGSTHQWPNIVMLAMKERWGFALLPNVVAGSMTAFQSLQNANGGCGYTANNSWVNVAKTGGMLGGYTLGNKMIPADDNANRGLSFLGANWNNDPAPYGEGGSWAGDFYAMYGVKKGLQLQGVSTVSAPDGAHDWYNDLSAWLLGDATLLSSSVAPSYRSASNGFGQNDDGSWTGTQGYLTSSGQSPAITTADAVLVLTKAVTKPLPVAVIAAIPDQSSTHPAAFTLDGSGSYHMDPSSSIVEYLWDVDASNGVDWNSPDATGKTASVNPNWTTPGTYTATLRVKDNSVPPNYATATRVVTVTDTDVAPVAVPIPPSRLPAIYTAKIGSPIVLDGSASYDPDGDTITGYGWDLNGDSQYGTPADAALDTSGNNAVGVTATILFSSTYNGQIGLQVTDNGKSSGNTTSVDVYASPSDLFVNALSSASVVAGVSLNAHAVLTNDATSGQGFTGVLVRFYNGNPLASGAQLSTNYTVNLPIGVSATIDASLPIPGLTNFDLYVYVDANNAIAEWSEANNEVSVSINGDFVNNPPVAALPIADRDGTAFDPFSFTFDSGTFTDPDLNTLSYTAEGLPPGLAFDSDTRTFAGTPASAGSYLVSVVASDGQSPALTATNTFTIDVAKAVATVALGNLDQTYSGTARIVTASSTPSGLTVSVTYDGSSIPPIAAGNYTVVGTIDDDNYSGSATDSLVVGKASLTVTGPTRSREYGAEEGDLAGTYSGQKNDETFTVTGSTTAGLTSGVGEYDIVPEVTGATLDNYTVARVNGKLTVTAAALTITAGDASRAYGQTNPVFGVTYEGFLNGETNDVLDGELVFATSAETNSPVGTYSIDPIGLTSTNYAITFASGTLTVLPYTLTVTADEKSKIYGESDPELTASYSGFVNGETESVLSGELTLNRALGEAVGAYEITPAGVTSTNYAITFAKGMLTVNPAALTITARDYGKIYNGAPYSGGNGVDYSGFVFGEDDTALGGSLVYEGTSQGALGVGSYAITPAGLTSDNYTITLASGILTVGKAPLTVSADNKTRIYGHGNPPLTVSYSGFAGSDDASVLSSLPVAVTTAATDSPKGTYPITVSGGVSSNYSLAYADGVLTVNKASLVMVGDSFTRAYGQPNPTFTAAITGVVNGDNITAWFLTTATASSPPGSYRITLNVSDPDAKLGNYLTTLTSGTLTVTNGLLTGEVASASRGYGHTNPVFSVSYSGFANGQDSGILSGTLELSCLDTNGVPVGTNTPVGLYPISVSAGQTAPNYTVSYVDATLTVTQVVLTVAANDASRVYGEENPAFDAVITGFVNDETEAVLDGTLTVTSSACADSPAAQYPIVPAGLSAGNYAIGYHDGLLTVTPAALVVGADNEGRLYGQSNPLLVGSLSGVTAGDNLTATFATEAVEASPVGTYSILPVWGDPAGRLANYTVTTNQGTLTVGKAHLTVAADSQVRVYGATNPVPTATYSGFVNGETSSVLSGSPALSASADTNSPAGVYEITIAQGDLAAANYGFELVNGSLTVTQAVLTVTADNQNRIYGETNPVLTATYSGFVNNDSAVVLSGSPSLTTEAETNSPVGVYAIVAALGSLSADNYTFSFVDGTLSVGKAVLLVAADAKSRAYGETNPELTATYSGFADGDTASILEGAPALTLLADTNSLVGTYEIAISAGTLVAPNYALSFTNNLLTVGRAVLVLTADDQTRVYGQPNSSLTGTVTGIMNGEDLTATFATAATSASPVGRYDIRPTLVDGNGTADNYDITIDNGKLTITPAALVATADNSTRVYGEANPAFTGTLTGVANEDAVSAEFVSDANPASSVGSYPIAPVFTDPDGKLSNYTLTTNLGSLMVTKALLTVKADSQSRPYGQPNPPLTVGYSGFVNGDDASGLTATPAPSCAATATSWLGAYPITVAGGVSDNYEFSYVSGSLTVTKTGLIVVGDDASRAYGQPNPEFAALMTGVVPGDDITFSFNTVADTNSIPGYYDINIVLDDPRDRLGAYDVTLLSGVLTVTNAVLTGQVASQTRAYGEPNAPFEVTYTGFVNGEITDMVAGTLVFSCLDSHGAPVGESAGIGVYAIHASGQHATNYTIVYADGTLTVTQAVLTVTPGDTSRQYGAANPDFSDTITGFRNEDTISVVSGQPGLTTSADVTSPVGPYTIEATLGTLRADNYIFALSNGILTVTQAPLRVSADSKSRGYGTENPVFTATYTGLVNEDAVAGAPDLSTTADIHSDAGAYVITAAQGTLAMPNYALSFAEGTLTVSQASLMAVADDHSRPYGAANPELSITYTGFVNGDGAGVLDTPVTATTTANLTSPVGTYSITLEGGADLNYAVSLSNGTLRVTKATVLATADNQSRTYGAANPELTITYTGLLNGETASVLQSPPSISTEAAETSPVGTYPIVLDGGSDTNYSITLANGELTVGPAALSATADNLSRSYGQPNPPLAITYQGFVNGESAGVLSTPVSASTPATQASPIGSYPISLNGGTADNYTVALVSGTLTVTTSDLAITANDAARPYGAANPVFDGSIVGLVNGDSISATYSSAATESSPAGLYEIVPTLVDPSGVASNYNVTLVNGTLTVSAAFSMTDTPGFYIVGNDAVPVDSHALIDDGGGLSFDGASLSVAAGTNAADEDRLGIQSQGSDVGQIDLMGNDVSFGGVAFGSYSGGFGTNALVFTFNTNATAGSLTALVRLLTFETSNTNTDLRSFELTLNYGSVTVTAQRSMILDRQPLAEDDIVLATLGASFSIPFNQVMANDSDVDGDPLTIVDSSRVSANGARIAVTDTNFTYRPVAGETNDDVFAYIVGDGKGGEGIGVVTLRFLAPNRIQLDTSGLNDTGTKLTMGGIAGRTYKILVSNDLMHWDVMGTVMATAQGIIEIIDTESKNYPHRFYRALAQ